MPAMTILSKNKDYRFQTCTPTRETGSSACWNLQAARSMPSPRLPTGFPEPVAATIFAGIAQSARQPGAMARA
jgi:hypothetical protein